MYGINEISLQAQLAWELLWAPKGHEGGAVDIELWRQDQSRTDTCCTTGEGGSELHEENAIAASRPFLGRRCPHGAEAGRTQRIGRPQGHGSPTLASPSHSCGGPQRGGACPQRRDLVVAEEEPTVHAALPVTRVSVSGGCQGSGHSSLFVRSRNNSGEAATRGRNWHGRKTTT